MAVVLRALSDSLASTAPLVATCFGQPFKANQKSQMLKTRMPNCPYKTGGEIDSKHHY
jgi:hypothetical protein